MNQPPFSRRAAKLVYVLLLMAAIGWTAASILPAYLTATGELLPALIIRRGFAVICHQQTARSFALWGAPLAICARCSGIYGGIIAGLLLYPWLRELTRDDVPPRSYLLIALIPTAIDWLLGFSGIWANTHLSRSITGLIAGGALAFYLMPATLSAIQDLACALTNRWGRKTEELLYGDTK